MEAVGDVIASRPDWQTVADESKTKILENPEIQQFIEENHLIDFQIEKSMSAFNEYLWAKQDNEFYEPVLEFYEGYALVRYRETDKLNEAKRRSSELYLEEHSVVGDKSIRNACFENFKVTTQREQDALKFALACARFYERDGEGNSVMSGLPGTGKSHLSMSILKKFNTNGRKALYVSFSKMIRLIQNGWDDKSNGIPNKYTSEYALGMCTRADLLVLDDIGSEKVGEWSENLLCDILDSRQSTIITTNLSKRKLQDLYDPRTFSRMYRTIGPREFEFTNISDKRTNPII